ncbi:MAG: YchJ family protein [Planctomycetota bacterium]
MAGKNKKANDKHALPCPCHSGQPYKDCCRPFHKGRAVQTHTQLMRARYAAYAMGNVDFILHTTHPDSPHQQADHVQWRAEVRDFCERTDFLGLEILDVSETHTSFRATLRQGIRDASFGETSLFRLHQDRWHYVSGEPIT